MAETPIQPATSPESESNAQIVQPGSTIAPQSQATPAPSPFTAPQPEPITQPPILDPTEAPISPYALPQTQSVPFQQPDAHVTTQEDGAISWTASEFIAHEKSSSWYVTLALVAAIAAAIVFGFTRDIISSVVILVSAGAFGFYGARQPNQLQYVMNDHGIGIGTKFLPYENYRSFAIAQEGAFSSIVLYPLKRFATLATIYYAPEDEEAIIQVLSDRLPFEEHTPDAVDRLMKRIRF
jgi:hypothetical protein